MGGVSSWSIAGLIGRLQAHVFADGPGTLTDVEVAADIALLNKVMPDLVEVEVNVRREKRYIAGTSGIT